MRGMYDRIPVTGCGTCIKTDRGLFFYSVGE